jgi:DNA-binding CsgD family transcriptional regulator
VKSIRVNGSVSQREKEFLRLLGDGKTTAEIAEQLKISVKTVQTYCQRLKPKLGAANFQQLTRIAALWRAGVTDISATPIRAVRGNRKRYRRVPVT